jgi:hypothetical protein
MGETPIPTPRRIGDAGIEEKYRGGEPSTRSTVLHSGLLTHLHSSHPQGWIVELGLLCRKRWRRTLHDECKWLAKALRETGEARKREQRLRVLSCGRGSIARKGVLARPPSSEQGNWALPGNGQVSLQKSFGGVLVQRSVVHTTQQSWCRGVTGDLARDSEAAWRHVARSRGERLFLQGNRPRKGTIAFGTRACESASFSSSHGGKVVKSTSGRSAPPVSETRPGGGAVDYRTREGTSDRESGLRFTRRL